MIGKDALITAGPFRGKIGRIVRESYSPGCRIFWIVKDGTEYAAQIEHTRIVKHHNRTGSLGCLGCGRQMEWSEGSVGYICYHCG